MAEIELSIRIDLESGARIGPGKIALLEAIRKTGSISAAAKSMRCLIARRGDTWTS
jgi:molybdate transport system regulatory protein